MMLLVIYLFAEMLLSQFLSTKSCSISTPSAVINKNTRESVELQWQVKPTFNRIFSSIECKNTKTSLSTGSSSSFTVSKFLNDNTLENRLQVMKLGYNYTIKITDLSVNDSNMYKCTILCISDKGYHYVKTIQLIVKEKTLTSKKPTESTRSFSKTSQPSKTTDKTAETNEEKGESDKKKNLYMWIGITAGILFILVVIATALCIKHKFYKVSFKPDEKNKNAIQKVILLDATKSQPFEEQQYADLTEFQKETYSDLNLKSALWPTHEYEYVKSVQANTKIKDGTSIKSIKYEYIDPNFQSTKGYV